MERNDHRSGGGGYQGNRDRGRPHRPYQGGGHGGGRGRTQRPLLTSSTNAAGLVLVALMLTSSEFPDIQRCLGYSVILFALSALISYIAQRLKPRWVEWICDLCYWLGMIGVLCVAAQKVGLY